MKYTKLMNPVKPNKELVRKMFTERLASIIKEYEKANNEIMGVDIWFLNPKDHVSWTGDKFTP